MKPVSFKCFLKYFEDVLISAIDRMLMSTSKSRSLNISLSAVVGRSEANGIYQAVIIFMNLFEFKTPEIFPGISCGISKGDLSHTPQQHRDISFMDTQRYHFSSHVTCPA